MKGKGVRELCVGKDLEGGGSGEVEFIIPVSPADTEENNANSE
jgi:hypothetical protein